MPNQDLLLVNGNVFQSVAGSSGKEAVFHSCLLVRDGVVRHVGSDHDEPVVRARAGAGVRVLDLKGRTVLPGFIDGHMHLLLLGLSLAKVGLERCRSLDDIRAAIRAYAAAKPSVPRIFLPRLDALDDARPRARRPAGRPGRPAHLRRQQGPALDVVQRRRPGRPRRGARTWPTPPGGQIHRDTAGRPTGLLSEAAVLNLVWPHASAVTPLSDRADAMAAALAAYSAAGYNGRRGHGHGRRTPGPPCGSCGRAASPPPPLRIAAYWLVRPAATAAAAAAQVDRAAELLAEGRRAARGLPRVVGIKAICDGVVDACTAAPGRALRPRRRPPAAAVDRRRPGPPWCAAPPPLACRWPCTPSATPPWPWPWPPSRPPPRRPCAPASSTSSWPRPPSPPASPLPASPPASNPPTPTPPSSPPGPPCWARAAAATPSPTAASPTPAPPWPLGPTPPPRPTRRCPTCTWLPRGARPASPETETETETEVEPPPVNAHFALGLCEAVVAATRGAAYSCFADAYSGSLEPGKSADFVVVDMRWDSRALLQAAVKETWFEGRRVYAAPAEEGGQEGEEEEEGEGQKSLAN